MARFEMSMSGGEKIIVDHPSDDMPELLANLLGKDFHVATGQEENSALYEALKAKGAKVHLIGGAEKAAELDARRAIDQGWRLAVAV